MAVRHRLGVEDIAAVLGLDAVDVADSVAAAALRPVDPLPAAPPALRVRLADPAGDDPAGLARRAGPFRPDGFPQPLDRRRLSGRVLAACIAVPVLGTLALLTAVPGDSPSASGAALAGTGTVTRAAVQAGGPAAQPSSWPVPRPAPATSLRPPDSPPASAAPSTAAAPATRTGAGPRSAPLADRDSAGAAVSGWVENLTAPACPARWTARVHVMVVGTDAQQVVATWFDGEDVRTVSLRHRDRDWVGELSRIPAGKQLWWRAGAVAEDGTIAGTGQQSLGYDCAR